MVKSPTTRHLAGTTFLEQGSGVPVVLVHGAICDHRVWEAQREFVAITGAHLQQLKAPTLIINGAETLRYYACAGEALAVLIPGARREVVLDACHGVETQSPAAYWQLLSAFISTHDSLRR